MKRKILLLVLVAATVHKGSCPQLPRHSGPPLCPPPQSKCGDVCCVGRV